MLVHSIFNSGDKAMIGIVLLGLLLLAVIILPKVFRYRKRMQAKQNEASNDVEILVVQEQEEIIPEQKRQDYENLFLVNTHTSTKGGKQVWFRKKYHDRITKIVRIIGEKDTTIFSYIDNVLSHHFETFQDDITHLYNKKKRDEYLNPNK